MRIQSSHSAKDRGLDAYFSPPEAVVSLANIEAGQIPRKLWEPAAGNGAIVTVLEKFGYYVVATDVADYGFKPCRAGLDYLKEKPHPTAQGIITNPPYNLATEFAIKAIEEVSYVALLLRTNFLESVHRFEFFKRFPPSRIWISSRRLPMMHRHGWTGPTAPSNTCFAWFIWDNSTHDKPLVKWFDWKDYKA